MRQVTGGGQDLIVVLDLHMLDIRTQLAPKPADQRQSRLIALLAGGEDDLVATE